jgi:hypothetical protein
MAVETDGPLNRRAKTPLLLKSIPSRFEAWFVDRIILTDHGGPSIITHRVSIPQ